ncbi:methyltransferase domain-containing protein [Micromonospora tarensis]|uniref:Methyltransferase domain-containing protein n=1 Tax=Micromonospora tarensis TaxID=2806100 RepID=A0ABS1YFW8_9ACTN|nr:methyltransferase domain-containing protein [Micromonospora tarensis]MBM0276304.1 methyltransferase domain-containing protein [Micromonospora tarensis]
MAELEKILEPADGAPAVAARLDAVEHHPAIAELRRYSYGLLGLEPADAVVDVGSGTGRAVAELTGAGFHAIGVDPDEDMLAVARTRYPFADLLSGTGECLPIRSASMAGYRADKVLHQVAEPIAAVREARRVLRPGGRAVLLGQDWDALIIDSSDGVLTRRIVQARADTIPHPRVARSYRDLLLAAGFTAVSLEARTVVFTEAPLVHMLTGLATAAREAGAVTAEQATVWLTDQRDRAAAGRLMVALPFFVAAGTAPRPTRAGRRRTSG